MTGARLKSAGFTLIEIVVATAIFTLIMYGLIILVSTILNNSTNQGNLLATNDQAQRVAFNLIQELRNATTSATGAYPIDTASSQLLIFYSNNAGSINRIHYYLQNGNLYEGITKPTGSPATYNLASEVDTLVQNNVANGATPLFYYYDGTYNGVTNNPLTQPVNVTAVTFASINLIIYKKLTPTSTGTYTVTASGAIRNLKTNLGS